MMSLRLPGSGVRGDDAARPNEGDVVEARFIPTPVDGSWAHYLNGISA
jgi:hypothetical protein